MDIRSGRYKGYLLVVLLLLLVLNKVEHAALGVLLQDIKLDLDLSDAQLGLLSGIAFTLFYATAGVPIARWADRGNRVTIISITTALQCGALALSGAAANFVQLLLIRVGVAVGEAGCVASANSLIADYFNRAERPRATAWFMLGYPMSAVSGYFLGGWLNALVGWRATFVILGLPGLLVAALAFFTLREPRQQSSQPAPVKAEVPALGPLIRTLWSNTSYRHLVLGYSLATFFGIGVIMWLPTFFIRTHGFTTKDLGLWMALIWGIGGFAGTYLGGELATRRAAQNEPLQVKVIALAFAVAGFMATGIYLSPNPYLAFVLIGFCAAVNYGTAGPLFATIQTLVPERTRAVAVATTYLFTNLIGVGAGPVAVGLLSDGLRPIVGDDSLRWALLALCPGYLWASWHMWRASRTVVRDVRLAEATSALNVPA